MDYNVYEKDGKVIIQDARDFEPRHIFECGQCFRWNEECDESFTGVAFGKVINVKKEDGNIIISNSNMKDFENIWYDYFDMGRDYTKIKKILSSDETLLKATEFGSGIRILNQDEWEIMVSFIVSANNRIPMIKKAIMNLSESFGDFIEEYNGVKYYSFPKPEKLQGLTEDDLRGCKTGFRAKYIISAAEIVGNKEIDIYTLKNIDTDMARKILMQFSGIGPKVSDCIMLFSMGKQDAFPIDIWVKRVMEHFYLDEDTKLKDIQTYAEEKFGEYAGFAQQYLFYYARELGIGKKKK